MRNKTRCIKGNFFIEIWTATGDEIQITTNGKDPYVLLLKELPGFTVSSFIDHIFRQDGDKIISGTLALILLATLLTRVSLSEE